MRTTVRRVCWLAVVPVIALLGSASLSTAADWPTRAALGDVLVTQAGKVLVFASSGGTVAKESIDVPGDPREIAFDTDLNAYLATLDGTTGRIVKLPATSSHTPDLAAVTFTSALVDSTYNISTPIPRSVAFDRLQNLWVGLDNVKSMPGNKLFGVIQRYAKDSPTDPFTLKDEFSVPSDGGPISLDVYVTQAGTSGTPIVLYTSRGKTVRQVGVTNPKWTLTGSGTATQLRILQPGKGDGFDIGGVMVGFTTEYKFVTAGGTQRSCNFTDSVPNGQRQRSHVELDADPLYWWAGDAGSGEWRKLDFKDGCSAAAGTPTITTNLPSGGGTVNGGLRVGPHLSFLTFGGNKKTSATAGFLPTSNGKYTHAVTAIVDNGTSSPITAAAWFVEVSSDGICDPIPTGGSNPLEDPYLLADFDCRNVTNQGVPPGTNNFLPYAIQGTSRGREHYVWIHEISSLPPSNVQINVSVFYNGTFLPAPPPNELACPSGQVRATWLLDDFEPDLHQAAGGANPVVLGQFNENFLGAYFQDPTTSTGTKTTFNHYAVARGCVAFTGFFDPVTNTQTTGSTLSLTFGIEDGNGVFQPNLETFLNLTAAYKTSGEPLADRFGYSGKSISGTGVLPVTMQNGRYKVNVFLDPKIFVLVPPKTVTTFEFCVNAVGEAIGLEEFCMPVNVKAGGKK